MLSALCSYMRFPKRTRKSPIEATHTVDSPIEATYTVDSPIEDYVWSIGHKRFILQAKQGTGEFIQTPYVYNKPRKSRKKAKSFSSAIKKRPKLRSNLCIIWEECVY